MCGARAFMLSKLNGAWLHILALQEVGSPGEEDRNMQNVSGEESGEVLFGEEERRE